MPTHERAAETIEPVEPTEPTRPRSRRALLTAAAAAGGALATQALVRPSPVSAADVVLGAVNTATAATTIRNTQALNSAKALVGLVTTTIAGPSTAGVQGQSNAQNGNGLFGVALSGPSAKGAWGRSANGFGVYGEATATTGANYGVRGITPSTTGVGVQGIATATSGGTYGVFGSVSSPAGRGVHGASTGANGTGVFGVANSGASAKGVHGRTVDGRGVFGEATGSVGQPNGVYGEATGQGGVGVKGHGVTGVLGDGEISGVRGIGGTYGVYGLATGSVGFPYGVYGNGDTGVRGDGGRYGLFGSGSLTGVYGEGGTHGVFGGGSGNKYGVSGFSNDATGAAVFGQGPQAGYFVGNVFVEGTLGKSGGSFVIDHPQNPANKTLEHSFVEAPERLNIYRGSVILKSRGSASIRLPRYHDALNRDHHVQLTAVGASAPGLYVASEVQDGRFAIAGGVPGQKVYWIVTGVRQDAWAQKHPLRVERAKKRKDRGKYLNPEAFGKPRSAAMHPAPKVPRRPRRLPGPKAAQS